MISKRKLKRLKELAEHKMAIAETSVQGSIELAYVDPKDLLELVDAAELYRRTFMMLLSQNAGASVWCQRDS